MPSGLPVQASRRLILLGSLVALAHVSAAAAGQFEVSGSVGATAVHDHQAVDYRLVPPAQAIISVQTTAPLNVATSGGFVFSLGCAWTFHPSVALEGRLDSIDLAADSGTALYTAQVKLPSFLPDLEQGLTLGPARIAFARPTVLSVGLRLRPPHGWHHVSWTAAGGLSYLPAGQIAAVEPVSLGALTIGGLTLGTPVAIPAGDIRLQAQAPGRVGGHLAGGLDIEVGRRFHIRPEVRYNRLRAAQARWVDTTASAPLGPRDAVIGDSLVSLAPLDLPSAFLLLQTAVVFRF
jgi:hypothetical protein